MLYYMPNSYYKHRTYEYYLLNLRKPKMSKDEKHISNKKQKQSL